jgi:quinol monooxygenase YgiN
MYMRFVRMNAVADKVATLINFYDKAIVPVLQNTQGCRYAWLIQNTRRESELISMTLWDKITDAEEYEKSGRFKQLYDKVRPLLEDASEWKIQLTADFTLEYRPESDEPEIASYTITYMQDGELPELRKFSPMYVRMLSARVVPGHYDEVREIYKREIGPGLQKIKGCKYAFLTQNLRQQDEIFSITIWENKQAADDYERSGMFNEYVGKIRHLFSDLSQTIIGVEDKPGKKIITSDDPILEQYTVVTGKDLNNKNG